MSSSVTIVSKSVWEFCYCCLSEEVGVDVKLLIRYFSI